MSPNLLIRAKLNRIGLKQVGDVRGLNMLEYLQFQFELVQFNVSLFV